MNISEIEKAVAFCKAGVGDSKAPEEQRCFKIEMGRIYSYNGLMTFSAPIPLAFDACPNADSFEAAVENCEDNFNLGYDGSKVIFRSGKFSAKVDCLAQGFEVKDVDTSNPMPIGAPILPVIKTLLPFVGTDPNRVWSQSILFREKSAFATCNAIIIEHWVGHSIPNDFAIPTVGLKTLLKLGEEPVGLTVNSDSVTVHLTGDRWFRIKTFEDPWIDPRYILAMSNWSDVPPTPEGFFKAIGRLNSFSSLFTDACVSNGAISVGNGRIEVDGLAGEAKTMYKFLRLLETVATKISFSDANRIRFIGRGLRGVLIGKSVS